MSRSFDAVDDQLQISGVGFAAAGLTLMAWFQWDGTTDAGQTTGLLGSFEPTGQDLLWRISKTNSFMRFESPTATARGMWDTPTASISSSGWQCLAVVYSSGVNLTPTLYISGISQAVTITQTAAGAFNTNSGAMYIMGDSAATLSLGGSVAYLSYWNRLLSEGEIRQATWVPGSVQNGLKWFYTLVAGTDPEIPAVENVVGPGTMVVVGAVSVPGQPPVSGIFTKLKTRMEYAL